MLKRENNIGKGFAGAFPGLIAAGLLATLAPLGLGHAHGQAPSTGPQISTVGEATVETPVALTPQTDEGATRPEDLRGNLRVGPATVRVVGGVSTQYNDNINYSEFNRRSDFIITPNIELNLLWQASETNLLTLDVGASYSKYLENSDADSQGINFTPDSALNFRVLVGKYVTVTFFDRFSFQQTPLDAPTISNTLNYGRFKNELGYNLVWNVNKVIDYENGYYWGKWISTQDEFSYLDYDSHNFVNNLRIDVNPSVQTGIKSLISLTDYDDNFQNDSAVLRVGPFVRAKISENTEVAGEVMYVMGLFDAPTRVAGRSNFDGDDIQNVNANGQITNRLNQHMSQRFNAGYETRLGTTSNFYDIAYARYAYSWQVLSPLTFDVEGFYEYGTESGTIFSENFHRYGAGAGLSYRLTKSIVTGLKYKYIEKDSDQFGNDYFQNSVTLDFQYRF
jgi:opacity protein-like surface antigen